MLSPKEAYVLSLVQPNETVQLLERLVRIDSTNGTQAIVQEISLWLESHGLNAELDEVAPGHTNLLVGVGPPIPPRLLYSCHLDTVPVGAHATWAYSPLAATITGGRLYGRGASDDKSGVAAMLMAAIALKRSGMDLCSQLLVTCVAAETLGNMGTRHLVEKGLTADFAVVGEYSEGDKIATAYRGALWAVIHVKGKTAHTGRAYRGADAIAAALDHVIPALRNHSFGDDRHALLPPSALTVTQISAGHTRTSLADRCDITLDVRLLPNQSYQRVWGQLCDVIRRAEEESSGITCEAEFLYGVDGFETPVESDAVGLLSNCIADLIGTTPRAMGKVGMCDGNVLANQLGIPTIIYGPGNPSGMGTDEYCDLEALETARRVYALMALRYLAPSPEEKLTNPIRS